MTLQIEINMAPLKTNTITKRKEQSWAVLPDWATYPQLGYFGSKLAGEKWRWGNSPKPIFGLLLKIFTSMRKFQPFPQKRAYIFFNSP